ncbi:V8-like Glu-specific endopeptidase [Kitasatospora sp. GAS204A]|uniref:trypsin-like serine peptidase n=1 Tax=unclassified Kitasatospora TaxID=2633591 RepID=UPI0024755B66|nr:trypsin-like peptidase domain-containing protein [Kitasatospora sp. GAS204B]MDH6118653.1 V8-like Glu-specific endopeptidase [Kitasatospora sp. GAS204B]
MAGPQRLRGALALGTAMAGLLAAAGCASSQGSEHPAPGLSAAIAPPDSHSARVGVLLFDQGASRSCTASVVDSPGRDLLVTAAHCVTATDGSPVTGLSFAPGYRDGAAPLGSWTVDRVVVDHRWSANADPEYDVAFLTVDPAGGRQIEDVVGGNPLGVNRGFGLAVTVTGYPNDHEEPITCTTRTTARSATQERFDCGGFSDGTSGSPWLTEDDTVVGVIGGYQQGGDTPDVSYSVTFDNRVAALYQQATGQ